ncbi:Protocadherin protein [Phytophthora cinnamomi]|uniref:Protocadherin protein n=1 Tax=Phytophthora cinnamomi TaxID=4785 RepID=UPI00355995A3|nr:Protocadherin protein [Phytophthora cinnamomi]
MVRKTVTLLRILATLAVLASECDAAFGGSAASSSTSGFVGQVEAAQVAVQSNASGSSNSTALLPTSQSAVTQEDTAQQATVATNVYANASTQSVSQVQTTSTVSNAGSVAALEATTSSSSSALVADTTSTTTSLLPNWVGTVDPSDDACYRKTYISRTCSTGYAYDNIATCWAQCPLNYPVQCGMECIPQNDDCALEVITKVQSVATVALNAATSGVFGQLSTASAAVQQGVKCGQKLFTVVNDIVKYAEKLQTSFPNGTEEQIISLLNNSDIVIKDLPTAVCVCLGLNVPTDYLNLASEVVSVVNKVLTQAVEKGSSLLSVDTFMSFISSVGAGSSVESLSEDDTTTLEKLIAEGKTCGTQLQSIITKVTEAVADIKAADAASTVSAIRLALSDTSLFLTEIPTVTNNCIKNITSTSDAYTVRDKIRKALSVITDNLINSSNNNNGNALSRADYILKVADMGLDVIAMFDPTGIAKMLEEFIQPVCGPTSFIGEIDDGSLADALALVADGDAFADSYGTWTHAGDGAVNIAFESTDTEDVTVEIHSAGETIDSVKVKSGETVTWNSTVSVLQDKTMYFDRWRPGLLGLPGSGGGSLVMWVPRSSEGGHIDLVAKINVS